MNRLTFWFSNIILLRAIVSKGVEHKDLGDGPGINGECYVNGLTLHEQEKENTEEYFHNWLDPETFLVALEKVEAWIFSRIVESVWWQVRSFALLSSHKKLSFETECSLALFTDTFWCLLLPDADSIHAVCRS